MFVLWGQAGAARFSRWEGCLCEQRGPSLQAFGRPVSTALVVLRYGGCSRRQNDPGLLGCREDVDVRRQPIGLVECADPDETQERTGARIVTPDRDAACRATGDLLALAACGRCRDHFRLGAEQRDAVGLDECVQRECGAGLALAPAAVTTMDEEWAALQAVADVPATTAAGEGARPTTSSRRVQWAFCAPANPAYPTSSRVHIVGKGRACQCYSAMPTPEPPISFGRSFIFGKPSLRGSTVS